MVHRLLDKSRTKRDATRWLVERGLYAIVDIGALAGRPVVEFAERVLAAGRIAALQLRAKGVGTGEVLAWARALSPRCRRVGVPLYVNDRADVAVLAGADGVHVGMDDLPVVAVRAVAPGLAVGVSSHGPGELEEGLGTDADYVAFGPVFATRSKVDAAPVVGVEALARVVARAGTRPVVAIGGISLSNAEAVRSAGARAGAVIAALVVDDGEVTGVARALHRALGGS